MRRRNLQTSLMWTLTVVSMMATGEEVAAAASAWAFVPRSLWVLQPEQREQFRCALNLFCRCGVTGSCDSATMLRLGLCLHTALEDSNHDHHGRYNVEAEEILEPGVAQRRMGWGITPTPFGSSRARSRSRLRGTSTTRGRSNEPRDYIKDSDCSTRAARLLLSFRGGQAEITSASHSYTNGYPGDPQRATSSQDETDLESDEGMAVALESINNNTIYENTMSDDQMRRRDKPVDDITGSRSDASAIKSRRRLASVILDLCTRSGADGKPLTGESIELRQLIVERRDGYLSLYSFESNDESNTKVPHPKQLLHYLAPKIPAIRHSPDVSHRIRSARSDMDSGVAACLVGTVAYASIEFHKHKSATATFAAEPSFELIAQEIVKDRRFEQLVECLLCGVDVRKRRKDWAAMQRQQQQQQQTDLAVTPLPNAANTPLDIDAVVEEAEFIEGLSIRDSCRAAWGISMLRVHDVKTKIGGATASDLLIALLLRMRDLLLARLKKLRHNDFLDESNDATSASAAAISSSSSGLASVSIDDRVLDFSDELAEDAATAMWTAAAVRSCTGLQCQPLIDVCCMALCTDPWDVRRQAQDVELAVNATCMVGSNDIVERLALSEVQAEKLPDDDNPVLKSTSDVAAATVMAAANIGGGERVVFPYRPTIERKNVLLEWLSPTELIDSVWSFAVAVQGESENQTKQVETDSTFQEIAFDRILEYLRDRLPRPVAADSDAETNGNDTTNTANDSSPIDEHVEVSNEIKTMLELDPDNAAEALAPIPDIARDNGEISGVKSLDNDLVQMIDAAALLAAEAGQPPGIDIAGGEGDIAAQLEHLEAGPIVSDASSALMIDAAALAAEAEQPPSADIASSEGGISVSGTSSPNVSDATSGQMIDDAAWVAVEAEQDRGTCRGATRFSSSDAEDATTRDSLTVQDLCAVAWSVTETHDTLRQSILSAITTLISREDPEYLLGLSGGDVANLAWAIAKNTDNHWDADHRSAALCMDWIVDGTINKMQSSEMPGLLLSFHPAELSRLVWSVATFQAYRTETFLSADRNAFKFGTIALRTAATNVAAFCTEDLARTAWAFLAMSDGTRRLRLESPDRHLFEVLSIAEADLLRWESGKLTSHRETKDSTPKRGRVATEFSRFFRRALMHVPFLDGRIEDMSESDVSLQLDKPRRPQLKDLPVDILSVSKLACSCSRLAADSGVAVTETFTRVALRLLVSHNSRLMRDCPIYDLIRLSEAAARARSPRLRELVGLFTRRFVQYLNGSGRHEIQSLGACGSIDLLWSLGELGVKYSPDEEDVESAHRRLRLVTAVPFISSPTADSLNRVPIPYLLKLINSLTTTLILTMDTALAQLCLASMETRIELLVDESKLCEAIRVTERLRESVEAVASKNKAPDVPSSTIDGGDNNPLHPLEGDERSQSQRDNQNILAICDRIHAWSLAKAFSMIGALRPQTLRAVLTTATNKPTQFDELINAIEIEVSSRVADVGRSATQLKKGAARPDDVNLVSAETGGDEATAIVPSTLTSRLKSMFGFAPVEKNSDAMPLQSDQQSKAESVTTDAVCSSSTPSSHHQSKTAMELEELFELGVCRRLLDQYRRECGAVEELKMAEGPDQIPRNTRHTQSRFLP